MVVTVGSSLNLTIRHATLDDKAELASLIARSARELSAGDYTPEQVEGALRGAFGIDTQLIQDRTYFVAEADGIARTSSRKRTASWSRAAAGASGARCSAATPAADAMRPSSTLQPRRQRSARSSSILLMHAAASAQRSSRGASRKRRPAAFAASK
jgi:hypothetical protein